MESMHSFENHEDFARIAINIDTRICSHTYSWLSLSNVRGLDMGDVEQSRY
jgi:hypothetical protein